MDLRDYFAAHVAGSLAHRVERVETLAARAYEMADALMRERARRGIGRDVAIAFDGEGALEPEELPPEAWSEDVRAFSRDGLLDEPAPMSDDDEERWLELEEARHWTEDAKPVLSGRPGPVSTRPSQPPVAYERPGLKRTTPVPEESTTADKADGTRGK